MESDFYNCHKVTNTRRIYRKKNTPNHLFFFITIFVLCQLYMLPENIFTEVKKKRKKKNELKYLNARDTFVDEKIDIDFHDNLLVK